ncbi:hypothetical protein COEREDRAFT_40416 [Coemansia reversa NRRL 1564]|uniref:Uncharacterized protein n=1 Tax=Coemansia reversa (strain ATCC 12441 / NRRL 1564) TaxID=763665 RepID=A0A2G5BFB7_COERN|nr:hypothetical protein COEREDRAFT_40416 [Coemansia reversa NRRL 1564]|eukprot:PIA17705.1 hypothetical protein COEREDRAFT_40416 [Coemansia reversa NRRL 1564]
MGTEPDRKVSTNTTIPPSSYTLHQKTPQRSEVEGAILQISKSPYPALILSAINLAALTKARKLVRGYPSVIQCTAYSGIFAASAYALKSDDWVNGSGITSIWSAVWLFFNARNALKSRLPAPIAMTAVIASIGSIYGYRYSTIGRE